MRTVDVLLGLASIIAGGAAPPAVVDRVPLSHEGTCDVTRRVTDVPPDDPHASSFARSGGGWYANDARSMWAWWWGKRSVGDYKVLWVRPVGTQLKIEGRRLDGASAPLTASIPDGYPWTYHATAIAFPTPGCWQVEGSAGDARLTFIVEIP